MGADGCAVNLIIGDAFKGEIIVGEEAVSHGDEVRRCGPGVSWAL